MVAAVDAQQRMLLTPRKVAVEQFEAWSRQHLQASYSVALEATTNAWEFQDQLVNLVAEVQVANCFQLKLISASSRKTDKHDAVVLAKLLATNILPIIWVPPQHVRDLRALTAHRAQLISDRSAIRNRLHNLLHRHNLALPKGNPFSKTNEAWWTTLPLSAVECLQVRHFWLSIHHLGVLIQEAEAQIAQLSVAEAWDEQMTFLMQLPGIGLYSGMTILAAIGDIQRFPSPQQLVGYAGLGARVCDSANSHRSGKISKQGRCELRTALIACVWVAVRFSPHWRDMFQAFSKRLGKQKAIIAVARKLLYVNFVVAHFIHYITCYGNFLVHLCLWNCANLDYTEQNLSVR